MLGTLAFATALLLAPANKDELAIKAICQEVERAFETKDMKKLKLLLAPEWKQINVDGTTIKAKDLRPEQLSPMQGIEATFTVDKIKVSGVKATTENTWILKSKVKGPDGKLHTFVSKDTERDSWRKIGGKWKLSLIKQLTESTTIDGKSLRNTGTQVSNAFTREGLNAYR